MQRGITNENILSQQENSRLKQITQQQISFLHDKLKQLQLQCEDIVSFKSPTQKNIKAKDSNFQQIVMLMQKKIQLVLKDTKTIVQKVNDNFDKKFQAKLIKIQQQNGLNSLKQNYQLSIKQAQTLYKRQIQQMQRQQSQNQQKMIIKLTQLDAEYKKIITKHQQKQKEYINWIHHLQLQLEEHKTKAVQGYKSSSNLPVQRQNSSIQNTSRLARRHKIFDRSVSPHNSKIVIAKHTENVLPVNSLQEYYSESHLMKPITQSFGNNSNINSNLNSVQSGQPEQSNQAYYTSQRQNNMPYGQNVNSQQGNNMVYVNSQQGSNMAYVNSQQMNNMAYVNPQQMNNMVYVNSQQGNYDQRKINADDRQIYQNQPMRATVQRNEMRQEASPWHAIERSIGLQSMQSEQTRRPRQDEQIKNEFYKDVPSAGWDKLQDVDYQASSDSDDDEFFHPRTRFTDGDRCDNTQPFNEVQKVLSPLDLK